MKQKDLVASNLWFAWFPVKTDRGLEWLTYVERTIDSGWKYDFFYYSKFTYKSLKCSKVKDARQVVLDTLREFQMEASEFIVEDDFEALAITICKRLGHEVDQDLIDTHL